MVNMTEAVPRNVPHTRSIAELLEVVIRRSRISMKKAGISDMGLMLGTAYQEYAQKGNNGEAELTADVLESVIGHKLMTAAEMIRNQI